MTKTLRMSIFVFILLLLCGMLVFAAAGCKKDKEPSGEVEFEVAFYDDDRETLLQFFTVKKGKEAKSISPIKTSTQYLKYTFSNWVFENGEDATQELQKVERDLTVYASYQSEKRVYSVTFYHGKEFNISRPIIAFDVVAGEKCDPYCFTFTIPPDPDYEYEFDFWVDGNGNKITTEFDCVLGDIVAYAHYKKETKIFTLSFNSPYIKVQIGAGASISSEQASQIELYKGTILTIEKQALPDGFRDVMYEVSGATKVDGSEDKYVVFSNVEIKVALLK